MSTSNADPCMHELCLAIFRLQLLPLACMNFVFLQMRCCLQMLTLACMVVVFACMVCSWGYACTV